MTPTTTTTTTLTVTSTSAATDDSTTTTPGSGSLTADDSTVGPSSATPTDSTVPTPITTGAGVSGVRGPGASNPTSVGGDVPGSLTGVGALETATSVGA